MSNAISAQGTTFEIQDVANGAAVNITAITKAAPGVLTSVAHGLRSGDVGPIAAVGGMTQLNGKTYIVKKISTDTFSLFDALTGIAVDTTAFTTYTSGGTFTPATFLATVEHKSYQFQPAARAEVDKTTLVSTAKEFTLGLKDFGSFSTAMNIVKTEPAQIRATSALNLQGIWFRVTDPLGVPTLFQGMVKQFGESGAVDGIANGSLEIRVTGERIVVS